MLNEKKKEKESIPNSFKPKIVDINNLNNSITKYYNLTNNSLDNIDNIISTCEKELNTSGQLNPSDLIKKIKESFDLAKSNIKENQNNLSSFFEDAKKFFNKAQKDFVMIKKKSKPTTNTNINTILYKKQASENHIKNLDNPFSNKTNYTKIVVKNNHNNNNNNNNNRKSKTTAKKKENSMNTTDININKINPTEHNSTTSNTSNTSNQYQTQLSEINKRMSLDLNIKRKEIEKLKKELESKDKEIETLKSNINSKDEQGKKSLVESIRSIFEKDNSSDSYKPWNSLSESVNKILDNYKKENELLKKDKIIFKETINYLQNELIKNVQLNSEIKNNNKMQMEYLKNEYNKIISEINKKGKELQYMYDRTNEEKEQLKGEIAAKEMIILNLQIEIENIKSSNDLLIDKNETNLKTQIIDLNKKIEVQNKTIKEINEKYVNATIEIGQLKKNMENKFRTDNINDDINSENEMLKRENEDLKEKIENLKFMLNSNNNMGGNAGLNAIINDDEEEKQLLKLQIEELKTEYNDLECKYNTLLNNNTNNINDNDNNENENTDNKNKIKDLEKENERLKKLNSSLVARLEIKGLKRSKYYDNKSENDKFTISDEEYDLKKMAHGAKEKNNSLDLNIDYPGYQTIKDKYRELDFYYTTLEYYARKLLQTIKETEENKSYIEEIRKILNK